MGNKELTTEEWKQRKKEQKARFTALQRLPYEAKIRRQRKKAWDFYEEILSRDANCHVSVGGLDSITLHIWLKSIGINVPGISVSGVEDKSIQRVHKALGIEIVKSYKTKAEVIKEVGFPVISKKMAGRIELLQNPTEDNKTVRHAIITGECGEQGHFAKNSRMKMPQKWLELFGGPENENEGVNYKTAPFKVSNKCCYYLKEKPCDDWAKNHNSYPYLGMMASEGGQREESLVEHGCNYYGKTVIRSAPFAPFVRNDILRLVLEMNQWYLEHIEVFESEYYKRSYSQDRNGDIIPYKPIESIVPAVYGEIKKDYNGNLRTTKAQRTGCSMCGFGVHLEERPHRFDRKREENPKEWEYLMYHLVKDEKTGEKYGWGKVLDYIGVEWEDIPPVQMSMFDYLEGMPE